MKITVKLISLILLTIFSIGNMKADPRSVERLYVASDRSLYVSGETMFLSLYCMDVSDNTPSLSGLSKVAYLELRASNTVISTIKVLMENGRGGGKIALPRSLPTGNYTLVAYTKQMLNENTPRYFTRVIPVFNTTSTNRIPNGVINNSNPQSEISSSGNKSLPNIGPLDVSINTNGERRELVAPLEEFQLAISNNGDRPLSLNISLYADDDIFQPDIFNIHEYLDTLDGTDVVFVDRYIPEYEGEIVRVRVDNKTTGNSTPEAFLSVISDNVELYFSSVDEKSGELIFITESILEGREAVFGLVGVERESEVNYQIVEPFVKPQIADAPKLVLDERYRRVLERRGVEMQINSALGLDTLLDKNPLLSSSFLEGVKPIVYRLDDYTRFPTLQESVIEFILDLKIRNIAGRSQFEIYVDDYFGASTFVQGNVIVILDGIPFFDLNDLLPVDMYKLKTISIYNRRFHIGGKSFNGIVVMESKENPFAEIHLGNSVRIMDYNGVQTPVRLNFADSFSENNPAMTSHLFWDPQVGIAEKSTTTFNLQASSVKGIYRIVIEGISSDGSAIYHTDTFVVE